MNISNLNYNYVYFNANYLPRGKADKNEYNAICLRDAERMQGVKIVSCPMAHMIYPVRFLHRLHLSKKVNKVFKLPYKNIWYPIYFKNDFNDNKPLCFVVANSSLPAEYLYYLKSKYKNCKIVKIFRDLVKVSLRGSNYSLENLSEIFDIIMTYDIEEANKYGFIYIDEIESKIDVPMDNSYPLCDVFFAGIAKNRHLKLVEAYDILSKGGLKCNFYIVNVPDSEQVKREGIIYSNKLMPYTKMLYKSVNSRCMLEINQSGAIGYTSRFLEAVMYNKKFITDNLSIKNSKFYNPQFIQCISSMSEIDVDFVKNDIDINYHYNNEFSPIHLIEKIDMKLSEIDQK